MDPPKRDLLLFPRLHKVKNLWSDHDASVQLQPLPSLFPEARKHSRRIARSLKLGRIFSIFLSTAPTYQYIMSTWMKHESHEKTMRFLLAYAQEKD
jgi:hypothetical protein